MDYYQNLYFAIDSLIQSGESADTVFDNIIDHLAYRAEDSQRLAQGFSQLLELTRNNDPLETIPHDAPADMAVDERIESMYGSMDDINKTYMSGVPDDFMDFIREMGFSNDKDAK